MKQILLFSTMIAMNFIAVAQSDKYTAYMKQNLALLDSARTPAELQVAANNFERIANAEKTVWQPAYYCAYALTMKAFYGAEPKEIDPSCDKADMLLAQAESLSPGNSEITTLKSMVLMARLQVDGSRGMTMGPKATQLLQEALKQQPTGNPRAIVQMAQMLYYTPPAFGGSKESAIETLKKGIAAYESFKPASELDPNWGKPYAEKLLQQWSK